MYNWYMNRPANPFHHSLTSSISIMKENPKSIFRLPSVCLPHISRRLINFFVDFSSIAHCLVAINSQDSKLKWLRRLTIHSNLTQVIFFRFGMVPFLWIRHHPSAANISSTLSLMFLAMMKMGKRNENSADKWFRFTVSPFFDHHHPSW